MRGLFNKLLHCVAGVVLLVSTSVHASITLLGTRVIFQGTESESSIQLRNPDKNPYLIQSWASFYVDKPDDKARPIPFLVTPPLFRLEPGNSATLRILLTEPLPQDKESLYFLNIKSIPSLPKDIPNAIILAVKMQIKIIYRPKSLLQSTPEQQVSLLSWKRQGSKIEVTNKSAYYINFGKLVLGHKLLPTTYVAPGQSTTINIPDDAKGSELTFKIMNDQGGDGPEHKTIL